MKITKELVSEGICVLKQLNKNCDICHYWHFLNKGFKCQANVWNSCHD